MDSYVGFIENVYNQIRGIQLQSMIKEKSKQFFSEEVKRLGDFYKKISYIGGVKKT